MGRLTDGDARARPATIAVGEVAARATLGRRFSGGFSSTFKGYVRRRNRATAGPPVATGNMATAVVATAVRRPRGPVRWWKSPSARPALARSSSKSGPPASTRPTTRCTRAPTAPTPRRCPCGSGYEASGVVRAVGDGAEGPAARCTSATRSSLTRSVAATPPSWWHRRPACWPNRPGFLSTRRAV